MPDDTFPVEVLFVPAIPTRFTLRLRRYFAALEILAALPVLSLAQLQRLTNPTSITATPTKVSGRVVNAVTGAPVSRALVRFNSRAMLTDQEGKFQFDQVADPSGSFQLVKPGYSMSPDPFEQPNLYFQVSQIPGSLEFLLYPEAMLTGTLTSPGGEPLARVNVVARRSTYNEEGHRWIQEGQAMTDTHGSFRIPVSAGDFRLETGFVARNNGTSEAVLPVSIPTPTPGASAQVIHVHSGEEQRFDLRPSVRRAFPVALTIETSPDRGFPFINARSSDGTSFNIGATRSRTPGRATLFLPTGTYKLTARVQNQEVSEIAETSVTVTGAETLDADSSGSTSAGAVLRFVSTPSIPVELSVDPSATSDNAPRGMTAPALSSFPRNNSQPTPMQFGLSLLRTDSDALDDDGARPSIPLVTPRNGNPVFNAPPGTYRLASRGISPWYIKSASYGASDLLAQGISVTSGGAGAPIRLVVSNQTGSLESEVLLKGSPARACWIYLIASTPSTSPVSVLRCGNNGSLITQYLPPGSYQAIAFEQRRSADLTDPASLSPYSTYVQSVTITAGTQAKVSLNVVPQTEERP
jgi:hypothetical protein